MAGIAVIALLAATTAPPALADGGAGGGGAPGSGGAGGTGTGGAAGGDANALAQHGGGGGGGAGGGAGGQGGNGPTAGGAGGTAGSVNGQNGSAGGGGGGTGGGGGGGGYNGNGAGAATITNTSATTGGTGGKGGNAGAGGAGGGGGGAGGYGAIVTGSGANTNISTISAGTGGNGGNGTGGGGTGAGSGGDGGVGVQFTASGASFANTGTVTGGNGGAAGTGGGTPGANGVGGAGITGAGLTITNSGTITGGLGGDGTTRANAITFTGGTNSLTLQSGYSITGNVVGAGGDTLALGGSTSASFDVSNIGAAAQYQGFSTFQKTGSSVWTLTNTTAAVTPWTVTGGALNVGSDGALGDSSGALTLDGGSLQWGASFNLANTRSITLGSGGGGFDTNGFNSAISQAIGGTGALIKNGAGTLTLTGTNTYTGTTITGGVLNVNSDGALGNTSGALTLDGGTLQWGASFNLANTRNVTLGSGGGTFDTNSFNSTVTQAIGGTGALTKTGAGFLNLSGANTYSGGTTLSAGTLQVGVDTVGTPGAITSSAIGTGTLTFDGGTLEAFGNFTIANAGKVNNTGGTIDVGGNTSFTYSGAIADGDGANGTLHIVDSSGAGGGDLVIFSSANTYGAATEVGDGTILNAVTLKAGAINSFSANSAVTVTASSTLDLGGFSQIIGSLAGGGNVTNSGGSNATLTAGGDNSSTSFDGVIADGTHATALTKTGMGTLTLTGVNTYSGGTTVNAGTLMLGVGGSIAAGRALTVNGGIFGLNGQDQTVGTLSGTGGTISLGSGTLAGGDNTNTILAAAITGTGGFIKLGTGTLILDGINTYTGGTTINAGALEIGDASHPGASLAGNVTIGAAGALMGHGTISGGVTNIAGGTVAPGGSIGTLSVASYTQGASSTLQIEVSPNAASKLAVIGAASLNGTLALVYDPGVYSATTYDIVHAGSITGTFSTVNSSGSVPTNVSRSVTYSGTDVDLVLTGPGSTLIVRPTNDTVFSSLDTSALLGGQQANDTLLGHLAGAHSGTGSDTIETALAGTTPTQVAFNGGAAHLSDAVAQLPDTMAQMGGWFRATGTFAGLSSSRVPGVDTQGGGFMAGLDRPIAPNLTAGIAAGYSHTNLSQHDSENGTLDTPRVAVYGSYTMGPWAFDATAGYAYDHISAKRPLTGIGTASSTHDAQEATGAAQASYRFDYAGFSVMPNAGVTYVHLFDDGSDESGASGFDLDVSHRNSDSLRPFIGVSASTPITTASGLRLVPEGDIRYSHELFATAPSLISVGGGNFAVNGITPSHDLLSVGGGITAALSDRLALFADYHATLPTGNYWQQTISAGARYKF